MLTRISPLCRPGNGQSFPVDTSKITELRLSVEAIYAEAASDRSTRENHPRPWSDATISREEGDYSESAPSDEDGPIRRA